MLILDSCCITAHCVQCLLFLISFSMWSYCDGHLYFAMEWSTENTANYCLIIDLMTLNFRVGETWIFLMRLIAKQPNDLSLSSQYFAHRFAMHELGLSSRKPFKKCARVVGEVRFLAIYIQVLFKRSIVYMYPQIYVDYDVHIDTFIVWCVTTWCCYCICRFWENSILMETPLCMIL